MIAAARFDRIARPGRRLSMPGFFDSRDRGGLTRFPVGRLRVGRFGAYLLSPRRFAMVFARGTAMAAARFALLVAATTTAATIAARFASVVMGFRRSSAVGLSRIGRQCVGPR